MEIEVRLFAHLNKFLPPGATGRRARISVPQSSTLSALLARLAIPEDKVHLIAVNGRHQQDASYVLQNGDQVSIFPPLAGGAAIRLIAVNGEAIDIARLQQIVADPAAGAIVTFTGVVRSNSMKQGQRKDVAYLEYEAYGGMAEAELSKIAQDMIERWDLCAVAIHHRIGERLDIGVASVGIAVSAPHRQDAFAACAYCMDRIKETVPIWKKEYAKDGEWWVEGPQQH